MFFKKLNYLKKKKKIEQKQDKVESMNDYEIDRLKGDGQSYVKWLDEEYDKMSEEQKAEVAEIGKKIDKILGMDEANLVKASIYGFIVGDALGVPIEFLSRETLIVNPIIDMEGGGTHNQSAGTWSDDSSMVLATIDGIINSNETTFDYKKIITNFLNWKEKGYFTPFGNVFDIGNSTSYALSIYQQHINDNKADDINCGTGDINSNGNGSLMRILPISLYLYYLGINPNEDKFFEIIRTISSMTHSHIYSVLGCYIYTVYVIELIKEKDKKIAYKNMQNVLCDICNKNNDLIEIKNIYGRIVYDDISKLDEKDIKSTGYVVDSLEAAIWSVLTTNSFEEAVLKAVNLGDDTDTIGALTGGLAGIIYGFEAIPKKWINSLQQKEYIDELINSFMVYLSNNNLRKGQINQNLLDFTKNKYDNFAFDYYFEEDEKKLKLVRLDSGEEKILDKSNVNDVLAKGTLALEAFGEHDVTAFSAYMSMPLAFNYVNQDEKNKFFCFISEQVASSSYFQSISENLQQQIKNDLKDFYSNKELQLKWNFTILHPICLEIDKENLEMIYRPLKFMSDELNDYLKSSIIDNFNLYEFLKEKMVLKKYIDAQKDNYDIALSEIKKGQKQSHWMWYIFPQIKGIGKSENSTYYAINSLEEAKMYLNNKLLRTRLIDILNELLKLDENNAERIFGNVDALKLQSSMTLFNLADPKTEQFYLIINKFFRGRLDEKTINIIDKLNEKNSNN